MNRDRRNAIRAAAALSIWAAVAAVAIVLEKTA